MTTGEFDTPNARLAQKVRAIAATFTTSPGRVETLLRAADELERPPRDEFHTMAELYEFRMLYNALAFNALAATDTIRIVKSWRHSNGELCFCGGWFIVTAELPTGLISNHYKAHDWHLFDIPEGTPPAYDGHTSEDVTKRLAGYLATGLSPLTVTQRRADRDDAEAWRRHMALQASVDNATPPRFATGGIVLHHQPFDAARAWADEHPAPNTKTTALAEDREADPTDDCD